MWIVLKGDGQHKAHLEQNALPRLSKQKEVSSNSEYEVDSSTHTLFFCNWNLNILPPLYFPLRPPWKLCFFCFIYLWVFYPPKIKYEMTGPSTRLQICLGIRMGEAPYAKGIYSHHLSWVPVWLKKKQTKKMWCTKPWCPWSKIKKLIEQMWPRRATWVRGAIKEIINWRGAWEVEHGHQIAKEVKGLKINQEFWIK